MNMDSKKSLGTVVLVLGLAGLLTGCASGYKAQEEAMKQPINCTTAEGDIRALQGEKTNAAQQAAAGVTAIAPAGLVLGILTGTEGTKYRVATGEYNEMIDKRIADIKATCGAQ
jgi:hypothetical protein